LDDDSKLNVNLGYLEENGDPIRPRIRSTGYAEGTDIQPPHREIGSVATPFATWSREYKRFSTCFATHSFSALITPSYGAGPSPDAAHILGSLFLLVFLKSARASLLGALREPPCRRKTAASLMPLY